jgi:hypothetical protein
VRGKIEQESVRVSRGSLDAEQNKLVSEKVLERGRKIEKLNFFAPSVGREEKYSREREEKDGYFHERSKVLCTKTVTGFVWYR